jgi:L-ascorbate metabolism protein UlaG (beta-lactamase superfamily)
MNSRRRNALRSIASVLWVVAALLGGLAGCASPSAPASPTPAPAELAARLHWFGFNASVLYHGSKNIYFDPVQLSGSPPPADLILITHSHGQAWSPEDIKQIIGPDTILIISPNMTVLYEQYQEELGVPAIVLAAGETAEVSGVQVEATRVDENPRHLPAAGIVGYLVTVDGIRIYDAAETVHYPEMADHACDIALYSVFPELGDEEIEAVLGLLQTRAVIFLRVPPSVVQIYVDRYGAQDRPMQFIVPATGAYPP